MNTWLFQQLELPLAERERFAFYLSKQLNVLESELTHVEPLRISLDSRRKGRPIWICNVKFSSNNDIKHPLLKPYAEALDDEDFSRNCVELGDKVVVVGAGPAGLWAALSLARKGYAVELHEQGQPVLERFKDIRHFLKGREFNSRSNILFGEGGAGAFSDGKLTSRTRNPLVDSVLADLAKAGAGDEVRYLAKAHIGTDRLQKIIQTVRQWILDLGGKVFFNSKLTDLEIQAQRITRVCFDGQWQACTALVLATGHSARDLYQLLDQRGVALEAKPFAMGVRVEHPQPFINERQFGRGVDYALTGSAEYVLTAKTLQGNSSAYSFCMCPGGVLVPCASEEGGFATNGMSYSRRNAPYANSGIVVPVANHAQWFEHSSYKDYVKRGLNAGENIELWAGVALQRSLEREAFQRGGKNYSAPAQTIQAFLNHKMDINLPGTSFPTGIVPTNHWEWFPEPLAKSIAEGFLDYEKKIPGFIRQGLMVSPETRTSSPIRIPRKLNLESLNVQGLFPLGEGAGYAGGITTSAADGVRLALYAKDKNG